MVILHDSLLADLLERKVQIPVKVLATVLQPSIGCATTDGKISVPPVV